MRVTKENLEYYDKRLKGWHFGSLAPKQAFQARHLTEDAGAVAFYPVGGTGLEGTVKFSFTETLPATGDKGAENPSTITGVSSISIGRCGKNLLAYPYNNLSSSYSGTLTMAASQEGLVTINGTGTNSSNYFSVTDGTALGTGTSSPSKLNLAIGSSYIASLKVLSGTVANSSDIKLAVIDHDFGSVVALCNANSSVAFTPSSRNFRARLEATKSVSFSDVVAAPQLELGTTATAFEPYSGNDYTFPLSNTYYGGEIDLATGLMTVTHAAVTPDASTVDISSAPATIPLDYADTYGRTIISADGTSLAVGSTGGTVVYKLAVPQTVQLSPLALAALAQTSRHDPRLNTVYTDADSIQISYQKSPIRIATEQEQAILGLGGNV